MYIGRGFALLEIDFGSPVFVPAMLEGGRTMLEEEDATQMAITAYSLSCKYTKPSLTEQLSFAILGELVRVNEQLETLTRELEEG